LIKIHLFNITVDTVRLNIKKVMFVHTAAMSSSTVERGRGYPAFLPRGFEPPLWSTAPRKPTRFFDLVELLINKKSFGNPSIHYPLTHLNHLPIP
jgi:hypothetical protein